MKKKTKKIAGYLVALAVVGGGTAAFIWLYCSNGPTSIVEAILQRKDDLPGNYLVVLPQSATSSLGRRAVGGLPTDKNTRRITVEPVPCFFMAPDEKPGLGSMAVHYKAGGELKTEMSGAANAAKVDLSEKDSADLTLSDLKLRQAVGIPNPSAPCFSSKAKQKVTVATSELVAGKAELVFDRALTLGATGGAAGKKDTKASGNTGYGVSQNGTLLGRNIVLGSSFSDVSVELSKQKVDLGTTPESGKRFEFPLNLDGSVTIDQLNSPERILNLSVSTTLNASSKPPEGLKTCAVGKVVPLKLGSRCDFWLAPGNGLVSIEWSIEQVDDVPHAMLHIGGYRTNFATR